MPGATLLSKASTLAKKPPVGKKTDEKNAELPSRVPAAARPIISALFMLTPAWAPLVAAQVTGQPLVDFFRAHTTYAAITVLPLLAVGIYLYRSHTRVNPPKKKGVARPAPRPPLRPVRRVARDVSDISFFLDTPLQRVILAALFVAALVTPAYYAVHADTWVAMQDTSTISQNLRTIMLSLSGPLLYAAYLYVHVGGIIREREVAVESIHAIARDYLRYPKRLPARPTKQELNLSSPLIAVDVTKWKSLTEVDSAFVLAPSDVSVSEEKPWDEFGINLNSRLPRSEEWRVRRDPKGRGAHIEAANYPTGVLWDGESDPDPLTFLMGVDLDTGKMQKLTLSDVSPHLLVTGATSSGKTSGVEGIAAQLLTTPMPWDNSLYGMVHLVDPKGTLANRWVGRRGVVASNGTEDHAFEVDEETGAPLDGIEVMMHHLNAIDAERLRRDKILARYPGVATWVSLPDEVKRKEKLFPILVVLDEYLDHADKINGSSALVARQNMAREKIRELTGLHARKYRNVGMHTATIAQEAKMTDIGSSFVRNLVVRIVTGEMDPHQLRSMFGDRDIPSLPTTRRNEEGEVKTVAGRARFMNAGGQKIHRLQLLWFGGPTNEDTLNKWLPRGEQPLNGDFTPARGAEHPSPEDEQPDPTHINDVSMIDADGDGEPDGITIAPARPEPNPSESPAAGTFMPDDFSWDDPGAAQTLIEAQDTETSTSDTPQHEGDEPGESAGAHGATPIDLATNIDPEATFPTAQAEAPRCEEPDCMNDATQACAAGGEPRCTSHLYAALDDDALVCATCYWDHPVANADLVTPYQALRSAAALDDGIEVTWQAADDGRVALIATRIGGRKIIKIIGARDTAPTAQSHAGKVEGLEAVLDRINDALAPSRKEK